MEEIQSKSKRGGAREGSGRKPNGLGTTPISLRLRKEYLAILEACNITKNTYINDAVKEKLIRDGLLKE